MAAIRLLLLTSSFLVASCIALDNNSSTATDDLNTTGSDGSNITATILQLLFPFESHPIINPPPSNKTETPRWQFFSSVEEVAVINHTVTQIQWDFFSHMTITSGQCGRIASIVQMLNDALQRANPGVDKITSTASRIGNSVCVDDVCPCREELHRTRALITTRRLLEVKTRSSSPDLNPAILFPLHVTSFHRKSKV